ncbi:hypothetical protein BH789_gp049 [Gordonia phage GMA6]|uniref:Uncharacterized protein n=1 Tax=Gordonia phage GMA6 TaxID=1647285 RepID=A0A0K0NKS6_9CAUD|nr:hypothetical protein BH789_gp049 [Gordonia phage GMA6]AKL88330.1 hypothetical protein GMA6_49 [Gordonia phage GMA6]
MLQRGIVTTEIPKLHIVLPLVLFHFPASENYNTTNGGDQNTES